MMGLFGDKSAKKAAKRQRRDEEVREDNIRQGTARINSIFDGGWIGTNPIDPSNDWKAGTTYYGAGGNLWDNNVNTGLKAGNLYSGREHIDGAFTPSFFTDQRQNYLDYADPQLQDQYGKAQKELAYSLARSGTLDSSVRGQKTSDLQKLYDLNKQQVADQALGYENTAKTNVEDARSNLIATLNATGDAQQAANSAIARAGTLSKPQTYSPLTSLFDTFTSTLGQQAAQERAEASSVRSDGTYGYRAAYNTGLFAPGRVTTR